MITKFIICTSDSDLYFKLRKLLVKESIIYCELKSESDFYRSTKFDIISTPTSFMEEFNAKPIDMDCQIIDTGNKNGLTDFVVTSPNFRLPTSLSKSEMGYLQLEIPIKKVKKHFKSSKITFAVHSEYAFSYFNKKNLPLKEIIKFLKIIVTD